MQDCILLDTLHELALSAGIYFILKPRTTMQQAVYTLFFQRLSMRCPHRFIFRAVVTECKVENNLTVERSLGTSG